VSDTYWRDKASCAGDPGGWDLDHLDHYGVRYALDACATCDALADCTEWTESLTGPDRPQGVVQAGRVWPARNGHKSALRDLEEMQ